jgi:hypothetical protein
MARGARCLVERETVTPCEDILLSHLRTDMSCGLGLRKPYTPIRSNGYEADA